MLLGFFFSLGLPPVLNPPVPVLPGRILEEQAIREYALALFRLPRTEKLHEVAPCSVWTPHARCHTAGSLYTTDSYLCFSSREEGTCTLLIPLSEVRRPLVALGGGGGVWELWFIFDRCW